MARFKERTSDPLGFVGRFEAQASSSHAYNAVAAIGRLEDDGRRLWRTDRERRCRWVKACRTLSRFLNDLEARRHTRQQDLATVLREFIAEFEHSTWRMYQMVHGRTADPCSDPALKQTLDWFELVYKLCTYAIVASWLDDKKDERQVKVTVNLKTGESTEEWSVTKMRVPRNYRRAARDL